jgi:hypothetical protein
MYLWNLVSLFLRPQISLTGSLDYVTFKGTLSKAPNGTPWLENTLIDQSSFYFD